MSSEQIVQVQDASTPTKNMRTIQNTVGGNVVQSEVVVLSTDGADKYDARQIRALTSSDVVAINSAAFKTTVPGLSDSGLVTRPILNAVNEGTGVPAVLKSRSVGGVESLDVYIQSQANSPVIVNYTTTTPNKVPSQIYDGAGAANVASVLNGVGSGQYGLLVHPDFLDTYTVSQNLLAANDKPDVTVNHAGTLPTSLAVLPAAAALADATVNPTLTEIETFPLVFNGTTWDRQRSGGVTGMAGVSGD